MAENTNSSNKGDIQSQILSELREQTQYLRLMALFVRVMFILMGASIALTVIYLLFLGTAG